MGKNQSKQLETTGPMANNIFVEQQDVKQSSLLIVLILIVILQIVNLIFKGYNAHRRGLRKRYASRNDILRV